MSFLLLIFIGMAGCEQIRNNNNSTPTLYNSEVYIETTEHLNRDIVLHIATINTDNQWFYALTNHIEEWAKTFEEKHKNVNVIIESISATERLQTELMAGRGPDVVLLPTSSTWRICWVSS